jgi:hypothetical protein
VIRHNGGSAISSAHRAPRWRGSDIDRITADRKRQQKSRDQDGECCSKVRAEQGIPEKYQPCPASSPDLRVASYDRAADGPWVNGFSHLRTDRIPKNKSCG